MEHLIFPNPAAGRLFAADARLHGRGGEEREGHIRDQLLGCLPFSDLTTEEARGIVQTLQSTGSVPANIPPFTFGEARRHAFGEEEHLKARGVPLEKEPNRRIRSLSKSVEEFVNTFRNQRPSREGITTIAPVLKDLSMALSMAEADDLHPKLCEFAWNHLAEACVKVVEEDGFSCQDDIGTLVYTTLMAASLHPEPIHRPESDKQFDESQSWGPAPRIEAAMGLMMLAHVPDCITGKLLDRIEALSSDSVPAVRLQIVRNLQVLFRSSPDLMWKILERVCRQESSWGVVSSVVHGPLEWVAGQHAEQVTSLVGEILNRSQGVRSDN
jgi:hypothetical protein